MDRQNAQGRVVTPARKDSTPKANPPAAISPIRASTWNSHWWRSRIKYTVALIKSNILVVIITTHLAHTCLCPRHHVALNCIP